MGGNGGRGAAPKKPISLPGDVTSDREGSPQDPPQQRLLQLGQGHRDSKAPEDPERRCLALSGHWLLPGDDVES